MKSYWNGVGQEAKKSSSSLILASTKSKNNFLLYLNEAILEAKNEIIHTNQKDLALAREKGFDAAFIDRLELNDARITDMADGVKQMIALPDPVGEMNNIKVLPSGIKVGNMRVPLGVIAIIYESRPNVTIDAAALCLKSGNSCILRGGSEAYHTNQFLATLIKKSLKKAKLPEACVQIINTTDRDIVDLMITANDYVDIIIPRGGLSLVQRINEKATVPVIKHLDGICHTYVDNDADIEKAIIVTDNAKTQRYAPCNAMETLLVHKEIALNFLPKIGKIYQDKKVELRGCPQTKTILDDANIPVLPATEEDWSTEYLAPILAIKIVTDTNEAVSHINHYGSHHTDVIITENHTKAMYFLQAVDSACVMINASSRFCDGFEFGLGAEIGISTDKLHVRGPVGLEGLTSVKYIVFGQGEIRQ